MKIRVTQEACRAGHPTLTNGRFERPASARSALALADPPEAGWQMRTRSNEQATAEAELLAAPDYRSDSELATLHRLMTLEEQIKDNDDESEQT